MSEDATPGQSAAAPAPASGSTAEPVPGEEPLYICLNYCMADPDTGYCLTCGRPPLPPPPPLIVPDFSLKTFAGIKLSGGAAATAPEKRSDDSGQAAPEK